MENNSRGGNIRRERRPRIGGGSTKEFGSRRPSEGGRVYSSDRPRRSYSDNSNGERKSFSSDRRSSFGERKSFGGENRPFGQGGERRSFSSDRRSFGQGGERKSFGDRKPFGGERRSFGQGGERKSFGQSGERRSFGGNNRFGGAPRNGFRKPYQEEDESGINKMLSRKPQLDASAYSDNDYVAAPIKDEVRLNKFIANSGMCSRREADNFIQAGVVTVNGVVVTELGTKVNVRTDDVRFNGERLKGEEKVYIVMNKPKGYVTTASDPHADKTVMDLLTGCPARVFPVGRLDKNTTGVLMFTNDGEMAEKLTHPSYNKKKIYQVSLDNKLKQEDFDKILSGITLQDGEIKADDLEYIDENDHRKIGIEIHSGKNRIVRRIFESLGYEVKALDRVYFAGLTKKNVKRGQWRFLTEGEANVLKMGAYV
jgi:23S rRNA pseudouridine2605 synthase